MPMETADPRSSSIPGEECAPNTLPDILEEWLHRVATPPPHSSDLLRQAAVIADDAVRRAGGPAEPASSPARDALIRLVSTVL
eukprot:CAMPEP_0174841304 /NCGR_PEP_ID=MMETSP1114-20130205/9229_1 /TAXON_ID=312471 /ORGANISM="Neobodo designis, Strain CCAP 1951/1" /LENGTH=82 /DNA_ID=CAMNT_0016075485 /DNA_START=51 /DNA_END=295 /DNA_ORIENTATION=+